MRQYYDETGSETELLKGECVECPIGRYSDVSGIESLDDCVLCPTYASTNDARSTNSNDCFCPINSELNNGTNTCECDPGFYLRLGDDLIASCEACPQGRYREQKGAMSADECLACPDLAATTDTGTSSSDDCYCLQGSMINFECMFLCVLD